MRLSSLQKFILTECYAKKGRVRKETLLGFYNARSEYRARRGANEGTSLNTIVGGADSAHYMPAQTPGALAKGRAYEKQKEKPNKKDQADTITKSVESLIDKGFMVGYGVRTPKKWYIEEVRLMSKGRKLARKLLGEQQQLPLQRLVSSV